jgi:3'(2'), 5'-bisphosphate nucleotidase
MAYDLTGKNKTSWSGMLRVLEKAAIEAGKAIMPIFAGGCPVSLKADASPVTEADRKAEAIILDLVGLHFPGIPVIAEEAVAAGIIPDIASGSFFLVDPLDGTREFIDRRPEFTVNIAYIEAGAPLVGIVYAPALGVAFTAAGGKAEKLLIDAGFAIAERQPITVRPLPERRVALASRCHNSPDTDRYLKDEKISECSNIGSSLKFCLLAEGKADIYPRFSQTMEWDTAAGDAVLRAAGGFTLTTDGKPLAYGKAGMNFVNPSFVSTGGSAATRQ